MSDPTPEELRALFRSGRFDPLPDETFDRLARGSFAAQFEACAPYRAFCRRRGRTPDRIRHWSEIPAVPVRAFQEGPLRSDDEPVARVFETSGTTTGRRGQHALSQRALSLYGESMRPTFRHFLLPELEREEERARTALLPIVLAPPGSDLPGSSLCFMVDGVLEAFFAVPPRRVFGPAGLEGSAWRAALAEAEYQGQPVCLLGTAVALHAALVALEKGEERYFLPSGSRAMQTGGMKASGLTIAPGDLRACAALRLGLEPAAVVAEYGMTETCSQFYERTWRDAWDEEERCGLAPSADVEPRLLHGPPWARAVVCDPETLEPAAPGTLGVVRLVDLANRFTLSFLQTEDLAVAREGPCGLGSGPFALAGRAAGAEARGCSLTAAEWARLTSRLTP